jgi:phage/conjugal plasmid C-4 type zinc finger TraR family protein
MSQKLDFSREQFWPGQSQGLFDLLTGPKEMIDFGRRKDGANMHCEPMARRLVELLMLDCGSCRRGWATEAESVPSRPRHPPSLLYVWTMAVGWAQDGAVQDQIDATVDSAVKRARSRLAQGESLLACEECGEPIPEARRQALPGVRRCVPCQSEADLLDVRQSLYNRRGSKDSQLK